MSNSGQGLSFVSRRTMWRNGASASALALAVGFGLVDASAARAADVAVTPTQAVTEVVVTASRTDRAGFEAPTPTTVLDASQLQLGGAADLTTALNLLPAFIANGTPATAGNSTAFAGENFLNLRGIGAPRTLVLVDGRRFVGSQTQSSAAGSVDVNLIPQALVQRVEVVTGGASAAWGSDAVAGVVNYILNRNFTGVQGQAQYGISGHSDDENYLLGATFGAGFDQGRGHVVLSGEYSENRGVLNQQDRDFGAQGWQIYANPTFTPTNGQSQLILRSNVHQSNRTEGGLIVSAGPLRNMQFGPGGILTPFVVGSEASSSYMVGGDGINQGKYISLVTPFKRGTVYGLASYDLTSDIKASFEGTYGESRAVNQVTSSFSFAPYTITADNPFIPAPVRAIMTANNIPSFSLGRLNTDLGFITADIKNQVYRGVAALDGAFGDGWKWHAYYEHGEDHRDELSLNNLKPANLTAAIDAVAGPGGTVVCRNLATNPGCAPINLFGQGAPSAAAIAYVNGTQSANTVLRQDSAAVSLSGEPFSTWAGPVSVAGGAEARRESVKTNVDAVSQANGFLIGNPKNLAGSYTVKEIFAETVVPLLKDQALAKTLDLNAAVRLTDYSTSGSVTTWKVGLSWAPISDIRFRGTVSRDIRAANLTELFQTSGLSFATVIDPRSGTSAFVSAVSAGNPNLKPESADTKTFGVVIQPSAIPGLRASIDYYDISLNDAIGNLATQDILNRCFTGKNQALCALVALNPDGSLKQINNVYINIQNITTKGVDFEASYTAPVASGNLTVRGLANYVDHLITSDGITAVDRAGQPAQTGVPHWRSTLNAVYAQGPLSVGLTARYVGGGVYDTTFTTLNYDHNHIDSRVYFDASAQYTLLDHDGRRVQVYGLINNLLDKDPPIVGSTFQAPFATNATFYDVVGRVFTMGVRLQY